MVPEGASDMGEAEVEQRKGALECGWRQSRCSRPWQTQALCRKVMRDSGKLSGHL